LKSQKHATAWLVQVADDASTSSAYLIIVLVSHRHLFLG